MTATSLDQHCYCYSGDPGRVSGVGVAPLMAEHCCTDLLLVQLADWGVAQSVGVAALDAYSAFRQIPQVLTSTELHDYN